MAARTANIAVGEFDWHESPVVDVTIHLAFVHSHSVNINMDPAFADAEPRWALRFFACLPLSVCV